MSELYPLHVLIVSNYLEKYQTLAPYFQKITCTNSLFKAIKIKVRGKPDVAIIENQRYSRFIGFILKNLLHLPILLDDPQTSPLKYDLTPYYKPATYHPKIKESDLYIQQKEEGWGELRIQAIAAGRVVMYPSDTKDEVQITNYYFAHPEEAYRIAKNDQQYVKTHLESEILPNYLARKLYGIAISK